jgi:hypothetical protein
MTAISPAPGAPDGVQLLAVAKAPVVAVFQYLRMSPSYAGDAGCRTGMRASSSRLRGESAETMPSLIPLL